LQKVRIGVVGAGYISQHYHCPALKNLSRKYPQLELAAICDLRLERAAELAATFGFGAHYTDYTRMLEQQELDGAYILVDPAHLKEVAMEFIHRGIPLLLEKPPGKSSDEVRELIAAAEEKGVSPLVALNRRFMPLVQRMRKLIEQLGRPPQVLVAQMLRHQRTEEDFAYSTAVHAVDLMRYLGGDVCELRVEKFSPAGNQACSYLVDFLFESGLRGRLSILPEAGLNVERYTVHGSNYTVMLEAPLEWTVDYPGRLIFFEGTENHFVQDNRSLPQSLQDRLAITGFLGESSHFLDCLLGGRTPRPSLSDCLQSVELAEAIGSGKSIKVQGG